MVLGIAEGVPIHQTFRILILPAFQVIDVVDLFIHLVVVVGRVFVCRGRVLVSSYKVVIRESQCLVFKVLILQDVLPSRKLPHHLLRCIYLLLSLLVLYR
jgi:hypothetical protein